MFERDIPYRDLANGWARTARESFAASAEYFRSLPGGAWTDPTGCAKWNEHELAGHIVGEVVWFPNLVRGVTEGEAPLPMSRYEELKQLPGDQIASITAEAARDLEASVAAATDENLQALVDLGFTKMPLWRACYVSALEGVLHNWDARARREDGATVPEDWALQVGNAASLARLAPLVAHRDAIAGAEGVYLLDIAEGVGLLTVIVTEGNVTVEQGGTRVPKVTLHLSADEALRLITGRLPLASHEGQWIHIDGDPVRASRLNLIFAGIAN
jgi:uncharacterized protein (TIGR03083 family)